MLEYFLQRPLKIVVTSRWITYMIWNQKLYITDRQGHFRLQPSPPFPPLALYCEDEVPTVLTSIGTFYQVQLGAFYTQTPNDNINQIANFYEST